MKFIGIPILVALLTATSWAQSNVFPISDSSIQAVFAGRNGTLVLMDCSSGATSQFHPEVATNRFPPCSTFKIWNALIGLENGLISAPDEAFYKWDGESRFLPDWNKDLTLKEAFRVSCVPAFQNLARTIGPQRMGLWIDKIGYGNRDISAGVDIFWLPAVGRTTVLISPAEQAQLICRLVTGKLPFSEKSQAVLKILMTLKETKQGVLYGKTGSGSDASGQFNLGWFIGYLESNGKPYAFACLIRGDRQTGKDARAMVELLLEQNGYL